MKGAAIVLQCLLEQGVDTVFGYPGVSILEVYDELYKAKGKIRHILTAHEQGAAHAADGYARATGRVGVCLATSGPGATNLVTGIAAAFMDSSPVVFITCNVDDELLGRDAFQEVDIVGISMPITKCSCLVDRAEDIADTLREAFAIAAGGRPGPVLVDITHNATREKAEYEFLPKAEHIKHGSLGRMHRRGDVSLKRSEFQQADIRLLRDMLSEAKRPVILAGGGVIRSGAGSVLQQYAEQYGVPVVSTLMGVGSVPYGHELYFGMAGSYGCPEANYAVQSCDLLLAVGVRFSDRLTGAVDGFAPNAKVVHIDVDRSEIDKNVAAAHHVVGDAAEILSELLSMGGCVETEKTWLDELQKRRAEQEGERSFPERIVEAVYNTCPNALIATDVGQHQIWTCRNFRFSEPGQLITSGGYGAMGFGLGAALGAKTAHPDKTVIHITGDGSFGMNLTELITEAREHLPVVTIVFNNGALGLVRQNQRFRCGRRYSQTTLNAQPDYTALAAAFGLICRQVDTLEDFTAALEELIAAGRGGIIDCRIDKDEYIKPMLAKGRLSY